MLSFSQWQNKTRLAKTAAKISFKTVYTASLTNQNSIFEKILSGL